MGTAAASFVPALPPALIRGAAKEIATPCQTLYKSARSRIVRLLAWLTGGLPAPIRNVLAKVLAWRTQDMAAQDNADTGEFLWIPDHQLVRRIGKGAYGEVWLARNVLGTYRGVKIVRRTTFGEDRPFDREFEGIQRFEPISRSHPGFVSILHVGRNDAARWFYYVMEVADDATQQQVINPETYVARTLLLELKQRGRLPVAECIQIGMNLSAALAHLHRQGLIHRDIKPANIIYIHGTPRLADVGLVATVRERVSWVGTAGFIPNEGPGTVCADVFGLGMVLYQIAVGETVDKFPHLPESVVDGSDGPRFNRLNGIILKACAANPRDRYQTADELHVALATLQERGSKQSEVSAPTDRSVVRGAPKQWHVTLLYKASTDVDNRLLQLLHSRLVAQGIDVFFDKRLTVGVQWAREIENRIRDADAVVILLSPASVQGEMLAYEVEMANHAAQQQNGRPLLLPVRVQFAGPWPEALRPFLDSVQSFSWGSAEDDDHLVGELVRALEGTPQDGSRDSRPRIEPAGGAVDLSSEFYVVRPTDEAFRQAVTRWDSIVLVKGARQMGKTSLLARGLHQARESGARVALSDFQKLSLQDLESAESFFLALGGFLADQLDLDVLPDATWDKRRSPNVNFERFLRREVLGKIKGHLVWGLDEVDRLFTCGFGSEVFGLFRSWHNERALDPAGPWSRLTLAMAYATEAHLFITDVNQSPFNVGTRLDLEDFTFKQVMDLNDRYGSPLRDDHERKRFYELLGGQPYLVRRALNELASDHLSFETLAADADRDEGIFGDHLRRMLVMLAKDAELMEVVRGVLQGRPHPDVSSFYRLRSGGLMRGESLHEARPRCEIYTSYLKRHLR
jgi:serine/threonine protein kinase